MKRIAILTSGGDAPGMNSFLYWIKVFCQKSNIKLYFVHNGYRGLWNDEIQMFDDFEMLEKLFYNGGTFIKTSRFLEFENLEVREKCAQNLKSKQIDTLIVLGGNGSFQGAKLLSKNGIRCISISATIDNNQKGDLSIGFLTALETTAQSIKAVQDSSESHGRCYIIETMGDNCGDLTKFAAIATRSDIYSTPENFKEIEEIVNEAKELVNNENKKSLIIVVTEKMFSSNQYEEMIDKITKKTNLFTRFYSLSFIQRGGNPNFAERIYSFYLAEATIKTLLSDFGSGFIYSSGISNWYFENNNGDTLKIN